MLWSWQKPARLDSSLGFKAIDMVNCSINIYLNASNYHLIDVASLIDTWHGHMVFLTKFTD